MVSIVIYKRRSRKPITKKYRNRTRGINKTKKY